MSYGLFVVSRGYRKTTHKSNKGTLFSLNLEVKEKKVFLFLQFEVIIYGDWRYGGFEFFTNLPFLGQTLILKVLLYLAKIYVFKKIELEYTIVLPNPK